MAVDPAPPLLVPSLELEPEAVAQLTLAFVNQDRFRRLSLDNLCGFDPQLHGLQPAA
jgi:hypothetical protein